MMGFVRHRRQSSVWGLGLLVGLVIAACSLNPQPLPPDNPGDDGGVPSSFGGTGGHGSDAASKGRGEPDAFPDEDAGGGTGDDSGGEESLDGSFDGDASNGDDAGGAAGDGSVDGASVDGGSPGADGATDGSTDGSPHDAGTSDAHQGDV
jgi:hypothetical protein